jgi:hypothetical protein
MTVDSGRSPGRQIPDVQGLSKSGARRIRTADLLGAIRGGGQVYFLQK